MFTFDVPGGGYTFAAANRVYGTLIFKADASGGNQSYSCSAASPLTINGNLVVDAGVSLNLDITAATTIRGDYLQQGGTFNLASQANNNTVFLSGHLRQTAGSIAETAGGTPVVELDGDVNQDVQLAGTVSNRVGLRVNNPAGIRLLSDLSLPFQLSLLKGILHTNSFLVTLLPACSLQADSLATNVFIDGPLRKEGLLAEPHFLFPVGKGNTQRWLALKNVTGNFTVEFLQANPQSLSSALGTGIHHISSIEYWSARADALPAASASLELSFDNVNSGGVTDLASLREAALDAGSWRDMGNTATSGTAGTAGSITGNFISSFSPALAYFSLAGSTASQNPLPLLLISFSASGNAQGVDINWQMVASAEPKALDLESSADNVHFTLLEKIQPVPFQTNYRYTDKRRIAGTQYYRLRITEASGSVYSSAVLVTGLAKQNEVLQLLPSFGRNIITVQISSFRTGFGSISLYSIEGRSLFSNRIFLQTGVNALTIPGDRLPAGTYIVLFTGIDGKVCSARFTRLK